MNTVTVQQLPVLFAEVSRIFDEKKEELCALDAKTGDGDLGLTMSKGFGALPGLLKDNAEEGDVGKGLMKAAIRMSSVVPSTMGTLMASGLLEGGKALKGEKEIGAEGFCAFLSGFASGIQKRGKCKRGDRTILDAIGPAAEKAGKALARHPSACLSEVVCEAVQGAREGVETTKQMTPKFGKAAVFAKKAVGTRDQGALAGFYLLLGMKNGICK